MQAGDVERPTILVLTSQSDQRSDVIATSFKKQVDFAMRFTYDLGAESDSTAFIADNVRGQIISLVFAMGDLALKSSGREFSSTPKVYADVRDLSLALGRSDVRGVDVRTEPRATLDKLTSIIPGAKTVGVIRRSSDNREYCTLVESAAEARGRTLV
ncbi:MAG: hypothetical protein ACI9MC_002694 [Kiritimatiellia bacterium]